MKTGREQRQDIQTDRDSTTQIEADTENEGERERTQNSKLYYSGIEILGSSQRERERER